MLAASLTKHSSFVQTASRPLCFLPALRIMNRVVPFLLRSRPPALVCSCMYVEIGMPESTLGKRKFSPANPGDCEHGIALPTPSKGESYPSSGLGLNRGSAFIATAMW